jgi:hypothetical protein
VLLLLLLDVSTYYVRRRNFENSSKFSESRSWTARRGYLKYPNRCGGYPRPLRGQFGAGELESGLDYSP